MSAASQRVPELLRRLQGLAPAQKVLFPDFGRRVRSLVEGCRKACRSPI